MPLEVKKMLKHSKRGLLSMARYDDPNSGSSSFSITLGALLQWCQAGCMCSLGAACCQPSALLSAKVQNLN